MLGQASAPRETISEAVTVLPREPLPQWVWDCRDSTIMILKADGYTVFEASENLAGFSRAILLHAKRRVKNRRFRHLSCKKRHSGRVLGSR